MIAKDHGFAAAARRTGVHARTIKRWMSERGLLDTRQMPRGAGVAKLTEGFSYTLLFDSEDDLMLFRKFCLMAEAGWPEIEAEGDRVAEALRGIMP